MQRTDERTDNY